MWIRVDQVNRIMEMESVDEDRAKMWSETGMAATAMKEGASGVTKENEWRSTAAPSGQTQHVGKISRCGTRVEWPLC